MTACKTQTYNKKTISTDKDSVTFKPIVYTDIKLINFIDSIGKIDPNTWTDRVSFYPDSVFKSQKTLNKELSKNDFDKIKEGCIDKVLDLDLVKRIFTNFQLDSSYCEAEIKKGKLPIEFYSFDHEISDFKNYAIVPGYDNGFTWECVVYFFNENKLIGEHKVFHRYGLDLNHYKDIDGKTICYYKQNFESGSGIWWFNYNFYKYVDDSLIPVLNELQNANLQNYWSIRSYWLGTTIEKTNPLTLKMVYYNEFPPVYYNNDNKIPESTKELRIIEDSTIIKYHWDINLKQLVPDFTSAKLNGPKILSYYLVYLLDNELLFINSNHELLKSLINGTNKVKRQITLAYLNEVKNEYENRRRKKIGH